MSSPENTSFHNTSIQDGWPHFSMNTQSTRRHFVKQTLSTLPAAGCLGIISRLDAAAATPVKTGRPNSKVAGVQLGLNVPYSFASPLMSGTDILANCVHLGLSAVELRTQPVESFLGVPPELISPKKEIAPGSAAASAERLREWRKKVSLDRVKLFRDQYETAGVKIEIVKVDGIFRMSDEELNYVFTLAKALGGQAISTEISSKAEDHQRLGAFADKHQLMVGLHGHATTSPADWESAFAAAKHLGANVDLGHFVAGNHGSPVPFIQQHHDRITHIHLKDRKKDNGPNTPFGEGDTPLREVLRLLRDRRWNIQATLEFEYKIPAGSDRMTEIARAIGFCRDALA